MKRLLLSLMCLFLWMSTSNAHIGEHPSIHDEVTRIQKRLISDYDIDTLRSMDVMTVEALLTNQEKQILGTSFITFTVNVPVTVIIANDSSMEESDPPEPFWLRFLDYTKTDETLEIGPATYVIWYKNFDAGHIGLGVNSLSRGGNHYIIGVAPQSPEDVLEITNLYPGYHTITTFEVGSNPYIASSIPLTGVPEALRGYTLIQTSHTRRRDGRLTEVYNMTRFPATERPDQVVLTWSEDPRTTQTIQWRTNVDASDGVVAYIPKAMYNQFAPYPPKHVSARTKCVETPCTVNDPVMHRHTAILQDLEPDTTYLYSVGDGNNTNWTELAEFTTAPDQVVPFSFIYMGDAQNGMDRWGSVLKNAFRNRPDAAFYVMAGDLVNRGNDRDDWDDFFYNAQGVFNQRHVIPALGNHEYSSGREPYLYHSVFKLPENGPDTIPSERAYYIEYSNALLVILDSNQHPEEQVAWLDQVLGKSDATWKFVVFHHPIYSGSPRRDNPLHREHWVPIFDKHQVDMVLQGHDHSYMRSYPMQNNEVVDSTDNGTIYVVSVAGVKMYDQGDYDHTAVGFTNTSMYQVLDIHVSGNRLVYRAYDIDGNLKDEVIIEK